MVATFLVLAGARIYATESRFSCHDDPRVTSPCVTKRGRLYVTNGIPLRLWIIGTKRVLAVARGGPYGRRFLIPDALLDLVDDETRLYGDFEICPLQRGSGDGDAIRWDEPGTMPEICVARATRLVRERVADRGRPPTAWRIPEFE